MSFGKEELATARGTRPAISSDRHRGMKCGKAEVARVREMLGCLVDLSGLSRREIERRLAREGCGLDVGRFLRGNFDLRLHQMLDIMRVLDIHPVEFFRLIFKVPERRSPLLEKLHALFGSERPLAGPRYFRPGERDLDELRRRLDETERSIEELRATRK